MDAQGIRADLIAEQGAHLTCFDGTAALAIRDPDAFTASLGELLVEDATESVTGPALDFCLVTTQRRNVDDTDLVVTGDAAADWKGSAQACAGPPTDGPPVRSNQT